MRNLIVCCDGTNNQFGYENTSVIRLVQSLNRDPDRQLIFYDAGVGTLPEPGVITRFGKWLSKVAGLAFGAGLLTNVGHAYTFLMDQWQPGDRVLLFGFSRGAYTARALASLLRMYGLLPSGGDNLLPYLLRLFGASRRELGKSDQRRQEYWALCTEFRETFARAIPEQTDRSFPVHFMGLFDTVSSVGWVWNPAMFPFTRKNPSVAIVRHAVSIDERRWFFRQNQFGAVLGQDLDEQWFAGVHADVGGGYPESEGGLWRESYQWLLEEAKIAGGLLTDTARENAVWIRSPVPAEPWTEPQHESLTLAWWPAEFVPKRVYDGTSRKRRLSIGLGRRRYISEGSKLHSSAMKRIRDLGTRYQPPNLPGSMIEAIQRGEQIDPVVHWNVLPPNGHDARGLEQL